MNTTTSSYDKELNDIVAFVVRYKETHWGFSPSIQEIVDGCEISCISTAYRRLRDLEAQGRITYPPKTGKYRNARAIIVIEE